MSNPTITLSDRLRGLTNTWLSRVAAAVHRMGIHPDTITIVGTGVVGLAGVCIGAGRLQLGGLVLMIGLPLDALDGAVARAMKRTGKFGAVLDSTLDRLADGFIFGGLSYYFAVQGQMEYSLLALSGLVGSFTVSYVRARAGEAGLSVKIGVFSRLERVVVLLLMLLIPGLLELGVWVLAVGTNFTGLQRLWFVYKHIDNQE